MKPFPDSSETPGHLPRLDPGWYRATATVFWTFTLHDRATGWLTPEFHRVFREALLHVAFRHPSSCPVYCLMPDHLHFLLHGLSPGTDQLLAVRFLRRHLGGFLFPTRFQHQAHDHVLRPGERQAEAFASTVHYIRENPVRKGWVKNWTEWPYTGSLVPGYPDLGDRDPQFLDQFWKCATREKERRQTP